MNGTKIDIQTSEGVADAYVSHPPGAGPWPAIIFYMDALGLRNALFEMVDRLASYGYYVVCPNLYYRVGAFEPFDAKKAFAGPGPEMDRVMAMISAVDDDAAMRDTHAVLHFLENDPNVAGPKIGTTGYCMGGGFAICAAVSFPEQVVAAASIHGGKFLTDPKSADVIAKKARAAFYIAVAEIDRRHTPEVTRSLEAAFSAAGVPHTIELYAGTTHGFAVSDFPVYNAAAAEHHWDKTREFFATTLC